MELANGIYRARAVGGALSYTNSGSERMGVTFEILSEGHEGKRIVWYGYFTDKTLESTIKALRNCGWSGDDLADLAGIESNEVDLVIENEAWEGKTYPKVRWVNKTGGVSVTAPMPEDKAKAFAAKMRGQVLAFDKANPGTKAKKPPAKPKDGLPF